MLLKRFSFLFQKNMKPTKCKFTIIIYRQVFVSKYLSQGLKAFSYTVNQIIKIMAVSLRSLNYVTML